MRCPAAGRPPSEAHCREQMDTGSLAGNQSTNPSIAIEILWAMGSEVFRRVIMIFDRLPVFFRQVETPKRSRENNTTGQHCLSRLLL